MYARRLTAISRISRHCASQHRESRGLQERSSGWIRQLYRAIALHLICIFMEGMQLVLKQQRSKVNEVVTPDLRNVQPRRLDLCHRHPLRLQKCNHLAVRLDQIVLSAARDPEQLQVGRLRVKSCELMFVVEIVDR